MKKVLDHIDIEQWWLKSVCVSAVSSDHHCLHMMDLEETSDKESFFLCLGSSSSRGFAIMN